MSQLEYLMSQLNIKTFTLPETNRAQFDAYLKENNLEDIPQWDKDALFKVMDGVIGALVVACGLYEPGNNMILLHMQKLGLVGSKLWIAYKHWADKDLVKLRKGIVAENVSMLRKVKEFCG